MSSSLFQCHKHVVPAQHIRGYYRSTADPEGEQQLQIAVKQYTPLNNADTKAGDVTIIACHAAGFFKEMYEPLFDEIYERSQEAGSSFRIRGIWIADIVSHGQSGILNEGRLGHDYSWDDHARDLFSLISTFRSQMPQPLIGLGHSMGAVNIIQLSVMHPRLFTTIVCIEPPIFGEDHKPDFSDAYRMIKRNDVWASRKEAVRETLKGGIQRSWDARALKCWEKYAFRELPTLLYPKAPGSGDKASKSSNQPPSQSHQPVTLTTTKHHAMRAYCRGAYPSRNQPLQTFTPTLPSHPDISKTAHSIQDSPLYRPETKNILRHLPYLLPSVYYIYGAESHFYASGAPSRQEKLKATGTAVGEGGSGGEEAGAVAEILVEGGGHLVPFEKPRRVAEVACVWMSSRLKLWREEREAEAAAWSEVGGVREKAMVEDEMVWWAGEKYGKEAGRGRSESFDDVRKAQPASKL